MGQPPPIFWPKTSTEFSLRNLVLERSTPQELRQSPGWGASGKGKNTGMKTTLKFPQGPCQICVRVSFKTGERNKQVTTPCGFKNRQICT